MKKNDIQRNIIVKPSKNPLKGYVLTPPDKSISHRAAMLGALTHGELKINNFLMGADCKSTLNIVQRLGVDVQFTSDTGLTITSQGLKEPNEVLDAGNSGTTMRLMSGILAGQNFYSVLCGDKSLSKRPMGRVISPLKLMGAQIWARKNDTTPPMSIKGSKLSGITYESPIASAQVKSCLLLAGLFAEDTTTVSEPYKSRDHSERMLKYLGADIETNENIISIKKSELSSKPILVPGDISSAAFFLVAASIIKDSEILIKDVGLNPTRTGIIDVLKSMGADIEILNERLQCEEEVGDLKVRHSNLKGTTIDGSLIPRLIDELPVIAVAATQAEGKTIVKDAKDLRNKESDRIKTICTELKKLGAEIQETEDGFIIEGKTNLKGNCTLDCYHDHRLAMSGYVAALVANNPVQINEFEWVNISFPNFDKSFNKLQQK